MADELDPSSSPRRRTSPPPPKTTGTFPKWLIAVLVLLILGVGGGGFFLFQTQQGRQIAGLQAPGKGSVSPLKPGFYVNIPDLLINLRSDDEKPHFLKLCLALEVRNQRDADYVTRVMPKLVDSFQVYLLELRVEDLKGAEGIYALKQNLLARVNAEVAPLEVLEVLFRDMLVQ